jgi:exopolysaccharide biosynthesis protein
MKKLTLITLLTFLGAFLGVAQEAAVPAKVKKPAVTNSSSETLTGKLGYISDKKVTVIPSEKEAITYAINNAQKGSLIVVSSDVVPDALNLVMKSVWFNFDFFKF